MDWRDVPSLAALKAFEATARLSGFSAAARELNVTHAAVAQHVRALEAELGVALVFRKGSGMALTDDGRTLALSLREGFEAIAYGVAQVRAGKLDQPLAISMTPSFAENWLMPRMGGFWSAHPDIKIAFSPSMAVEDLSRGQFDLAIRYGRGVWPGVEAELLVHANFVVVATPDLAQRLKGRGIKAFAELPWVAETGRDEMQVWAREAGIDLTEADLAEVPTNSMVLSATLSGSRAAIQNRAVVERDLAEGRLVCLHEAKPTRLGYYIVKRPGVVSDPMKTFIRWLKSAATE